MSYLRQRIFGPGVRLLRAGLTLLSILVLVATHATADTFQKPGTADGQPEIYRPLNHLLLAHHGAALADPQTSTHTGKLDILYLPFVGCQEPDKPATPVLNPIDNADGDGSYDVSWTPAQGATDYTLQEDDNIFFSSPSIRYTGPGTAWEAENMKPGLHYYRVGAIGPSGESDWSNVESVEVKQKPPQSQFVAIRDSGVYQGVPGENFGNLADMWAGFGLAHCGTPVDYQVSRSLVAFDLATIPGGTPIEEARLHLKVYRLCYRQPTSPRTITAYRSTDGWLEETVTWHNQPVTGEAYGSTAIPFLDAGKWHSIDVTNLVRGWVNGSLPNDGLIVRGPEKDDSGLGWLGFYTRESDDSPYLEITFSDGTEVPVGHAASAATSTPASPLLVAGCEPVGMDDLAISCRGE